jgi:hypothetical protein
LAHLYSKGLRIDTSTKDGGSLWRDRAPGYQTTVIDMVATPESYPDKLLPTLGPHKSSLTPENLDLRPILGLGILPSPYLDLKGLISLLCVKPE